MAIIEITDQGLQEVIEQIEVTCEYPGGCIAPATVVVRCRHFRASHYLLCQEHQTSMRDAFDGYVVKFGAQPCCWDCSAKSRHFESLHEILPMTAGGES